MRTPAATATGRRSRVVIGAAVVGITIAYPLAWAAVATHAGIIYNMFPVAMPGPYNSCDDAGTTRDPLTDAFCRTDGASVSVWIDSSELDPTAVGNINFTIDNRIGGTNGMSVVRPGSPTLTGYPETDIIYRRSGTVSAGLAGWTWCNAMFDSVVCDQHYIDFRSNTTATRIAACHETGHAVGLTHGAQAYHDTTDLDPDLRCMGTPDPAYDNWGTSNAEVVEETYAPGFD